MATFVARSSLYRLAFRLNHLQSRSFSDQQRIQANQRNVQNTNKQSDESNISNYSSKQKTSVNSSAVKPSASFAAFVLRKYLHYLSKFDAVFERKYPRIFKLYKLSRDGMC